MQALCTCLAALVPEVVLETLKTLVAYVRRSHSSSIRFQGFQGLSGRLAAYAQSWGSREEVRLHTRLRLGLLGLEQGGCSLGGPTHACQVCHCSLDRRLQLVAAGACQLACLACLTRCPQAAVHAGAGPPRVRNLRPHA